MKNSNLSIFVLFFLALCSSLALLCSANTTLASSTDSITTTTKQSLKGLNYSTTWWFPFPTPPPKYPYPPPSRPIPPPPPPPTSASPEEKKCDNKLLMDRIWSCLDQIIGSANQDGKISLPCCLAVVVGSRTCPKESLFQHDWFNKTLDHCKQLLSPPDAPQPPPPQPPPQPQPQPPKKCSKPLMDRIWSCVDEIVGYARGNRDISGPCCFAVNVGSQTCPEERLFGNDWFQKTLKHCQDPLRRPDPPRPRPLPPSSPPPTYEERVKRCWSTLGDVNSCVAEIVSGLFNWRVGVGPSCCRAISNLEENCYRDSMPSNFREFFYPTWLKEYCHDNHR